MIRSLALAATLLVASPAFAGQMVMLKPAPNVSGASITLGDLFAGASGPAAKVVVGAAPVKGSDAVLDAGQVQIAALRAGLDWDNPTGMRRILVSGAPAAKATKAGRSGVLAWARNIAAGELIQPSDLVWSDDAFAGANAPSDPDAVIGMMARKPLRQGLAAQANDVSAPIVVKRDEMVSVAFKSGGISLVLQAKAMKEGAAGDSIQVMNIQSKKVIEAIVVGPGQTVVGPAAEAMKARAFAVAPTYSSFR